MAPFRAELQLTALSNTAVTDQLTNVYRSRGSPTRGPPGSIFQRVGTSVNCVYKIEGKVMPLQARCGPEGG